MSQIQASYKQRIPDLSCARKDTASISDLLISKNGNRKTNQCTTL